MRPVRKGLHSLQSFPGAYGSFGGIKILKPRPWTGRLSIRACAVGTDACDIYGDTYPFILGGNTMAFCLNSGR